MIVKPGRKYTNPYYNRTHTEGIWNDKYRLIKHKILKNPAN